MSDSTNKTISDHEKKKQEHEEFRDADPVSVNARRVAGNGRSRKM